MRVVFLAIASLLFGIDSVVDAHPAKSSQPTQSPSKTVPIKYPTAASTTGALESGSRNNGLNALTAPLYTGSVSTGIPKNGSEINGTKIYVILSTLAPIPAQATWVNEYSQSNWGNGTSLHNDTSLDNGTFPDNGTSLDNDNPPGNGTYVGVRPLQKRHLPHCSRRGQRDTYRNRRGVWLNEYYFQEDEPRNPGGPRLTIQVEDYRLEPDMLALRLANRRPELDQSQVPEHVDEQIPTQRTNPAPARVNGGNARRPNNQQLHDRLGIAYPPYATTPESRSGRNLQDEDARGASRRNWDPHQRSPRRSHGFVS